MENKIQTCMQVKPVCFDLVRCKSLHSLKAKITKTNFGFARVPLLLKMG